MGRRLLSVSWLALLGWAALPVAAQESWRRFENPTVGISLARPAGWHTTSVDEFAAAHQGVRVADKELQEALERHDSIPLFVFTKYGEGHEGLNPTVQVTLRPLGAFAGDQPEDIMRTVVARFPQAFPDFTFVEGVSLTEISGLKAARMKGKYTLSTADGQSFKVLSRMWLVPRGAFVFSIAMNGTQQGSDTAEQEFNAVLESIKIDK